MKTTQLKTMAVVIPLALWSGQAASKSILVTGSLEAKAPKVSFPGVTSQQAFVQPLRIVAKEAADSGCRITGDPSVAKADHGDELVCLFEWTQLPKGMAAAGLAADGYLLNVGDNEFKYEISYFSGSSLEKVKISEGSTVVKAEDPILPELRNIKTTLSHGVFEGLEVSNFKKSTGLQKLTVEVDPRRFRQIVKVDGLGSCVVDVSESQCEIPTSGRNIGAEGLNVGSVTHKLTIDAENGHFGSQNKVFPDIYTLKWDYRAPLPQTLKMQARSPESAELEAHDVDGVSFVLENEKAKLVVSTPHADKPGSWWVPKAKLELNPDPNFKPDIPVYSIDGKDLVERGEMVGQPQSSFVLEPIGMPEVSNGKYIFTFNLDQVEDGAFIPKARVTDEFDNRSNIEFPAVTLDRNPPQVQIFYRGKRFIDEQSVYFFEDMTIVALDTFDGGAEMVGAKVNGMSLTLDGDQPYVKKVKGSHLALTPQKDYPLEITVRDTAGNVYTEVVRVDYMPMGYKLDGATDEYYKKAQRLDLDINQTDGEFCPLFQSEKEILEKPYGYGETKRCYLEWTSLPEGTSGTFFQGQNSLTGHLVKDSSESLNAVGYRVWMLDKNGNKALAAEKNENLSVTLPPEPIIAVTQKKTIRENVFAVELSGSRFATASAKGINADMELEVVGDDEIVTGLSKQRRGYQKQSSVYQTLKVGPGELWQSKKFDIKAKYSLAPEVNSETSLEAIYVPSSRIRARLNTDGLQTLDTKNPTVTLKLGVYDSESRDFVYDKETMGTWNAYLAQEHRDRDTKETIYTPISDVKTIVDGIAQFEVDVEKVGYGNYRFLAVVDLDSPVEGYERRIVTNSSFYRVLKGGAIDGDIKARRIASPVPFLASVSFQPESSEDRRALGDIFWEISSDGGNTWDRVTKFDNSSRLSKNFDKAGHYYVRATVKNKFSGIARTSEALEVLAYDIPDLKSSGPAALYQGEKGVVSITDHGEPASQTNGIIEWSLDGENWEEGGNTLDVVGTGERMMVWSRMAYFDNELAGENRYDVHRHRITVKKPVPVRVSIQAPRLLEAGKEYSINGEVRLESGLLKSEIIREWVLPDGTVKTGDTLVYTPTDADAKDGHTDIKFRAWVKGLKDDTLAIKDLSIRTWKYEFPEFRYDVNYRTRFAPTQATAALRRMTSYPEPVNFTYKWLPFEGMEIERDGGERLYFRATKPGIHQLRVIVKDDRGNEREFIELLEVLDPPASSIELKTAYSTPYMRQPLDVSVRSLVKLGHPDDRIEKFEWFLNDERLTGQVSSRAMIDNLEEGSHEIKVKVTSRYGIEVEQKLSVQVSPNIPPMCDISHKQYGNTISVKAECKDVDGRMSTFNWYVDGEQVNQHANNMSIASKPGVPIHFRVVGFDDSGDTATATVEIVPN